MSRMVLNQQKLIGIILGQNWHDSKRFVLSNICLCHFTFSQSIDQYLQHVNFFALVPTLTRRSRAAI